MPLMFFIYCLLLLSCQQQSQPDQKSIVTADSAEQRAIIYYRVPEGINLDLVYYDDFLQPMDVLIKGGNEIDSLIINNKNYTFLDSKNAIYDTWSIMIRPGDRLFLEYSGDDKKFNSYTIRSLTDSNRTAELSFHSAYNDWRYQNRERHAALNRQLSFWKSKNNTDSVFAYQDRLLNERLAFLKDFRIANAITDRTYEIFKNNFYIGIYKARFHVLNTMPLISQASKKRMLDSLLLDFSSFISNGEPSYFNAHTMIVASIMMKGVLSTNASSAKRVEEYSLILNNYFSGRAKELLTLDLIIKLKSIEGLGNQMAVLKENILDSDILTYLENEMKQLTAIENLPTNFSYGVMENGSVVNVDSLLISQRGKKVLINFWASWCGPCMQELVTLVPVLNDFDSNKVSFIFLSVDNSYSAWKYATNSLGMTKLKYSYNLSNALNAKILKDYDIQGFPTNLLFDGNGELKRKMTRSISPEDLSKLFDEMK